MLLADGEDVWSWRLDAGVKFAEGKSARPGADEPGFRRWRWQESRSPGRARYKLL